MSYEGVRCRQCLERYRLSVIRLKYPLIVREANKAEFRLEGSTSITMLFECENKHKITIETDHIDLELYKDTNLRKFVLHYGS